MSRPQLRQVSTAGGRCFVAGNLMMVLGRLNFPLVVVQYLVLLKDEIQRATCQENEWTCVNGIVFLMCVQHGLLLLLQLCNWNNTSC